MRGDVAILADDLTGALDAAAPFALPERPVDVVWTVAEPFPAGAFALDSETRQSPSRHAADAVAAFLPHLASRELSLKKIDSLLRGNTIVEIATCWQSDRFRSLVIAPAFPAQKRVTRGGRQYALVEGEWRPAGPDILEALREYDLTPRRIERSAEVAGGGVMVCDVEDDADLSAIAASRQRLEQPVLWCGSAGIARALSPVRAREVVPRGDRRLLVVGSRHPASQAQAEYLAALRHDIVVSVGSPPEAQACAAAAARRLDSHGCAAVLFRLEPVRPEEAANVFRDVFAHLAVIDEPPDVLIATGGDTLVRLCQALQTTRLRVTGEWRPGIPTAIMADGCWRDTTLVSKSGAFGEPATLADLIVPSGRLPN